VYPRRRRGRVFVSGFAWLVALVFSCLMWAGVVLGVLWVIAHT
jgi:hypothetical protein